MTPPRAAEPNPSGSKGPRAGSTPEGEASESDRRADLVVVANRLPVEPSTTAGEPPRISQTRWFEHKHDEVSEAKFRREAVGGRANCVACHRDAERGDFDDDRVKIPR